METDENEDSDNSEEDIMEEILFDEDANDEGLTLAVDERERVVLAPPKPLAELVQALFYRLEDIVVTVADYPPALHYVK